MRQTRNELDSESAFTCSFYQDKQFVVGTYWHVFHDLNNIVFNLISQIPISTNSKRLSDGLFPTSVSSIQSPLLSMAQTAFC